MCQTPNHRLQAQIFDENTGLRRNTVNGCFPGGLNGPPDASGKPMQNLLGHSTNGESAPVLILACAQLSALRKPGR